MDIEYCNICEKDVAVSYYIKIDGVHSFKGKCGHTSTYERLGKLS